MKLHVLYNTQVYNKTGNAHKMSWIKSYQMPPTHPSQKNKKQKQKTSRGWRSLRPLRRRAHLGHITLSRWGLHTKKVAVRMVRGHGERWGGGAETREGRGGGTTMLGPQDILSSTPGWQMWAVNPPHHPPAPGGEETTQRGTRRET